ncbi:hypothetical protein EJB05_51052 [Eragrostis curvula]|uniref:Uncharacterized protein n=1 Tax=Eragrostis curvula TaxID=38414 RepID=A0A5J9SWT8_9POAL|nr:hypothetical protein EJB05_51052 [Eragrostis curvula]
MTRLLDGNSCSGLGGSSHGRAKRIGEDGSCGVLLLYRSGPANCKRGQSRSRGTWIWWRHSTFPLLLPSSAPLLPLHRHRPCFLSVLQDSGSHLLPPSRQAPASSPQDTGCHQLHQFLLAEKGSLCVTMEMQNKLNISSSLTENSHICTGVSLFDKIPVFVPCTSD